MRQRIWTVVACTLFAAMVLSIVAALAYGFHLRNVGLPVPDPARNMVANAKEWQARGVHTDLYVTPEQRLTAFLLFAPALFVWFLCGLLVVYAVSRSGLKRTDQGGFEVAKSPRSHYMSGEHPRRADQSGGRPHA